MIPCYARARQFAVPALAGVFVCLLFVGAACADNPSIAGVTDQYLAATRGWATATFRYAQRLFAILALIQFSWGAALLVLERADLQGWISGAVRQMMWLGAFYTLLLYGSTWLPAIVNSFITLGGVLSGTGELYPSDVFGRGVDLSGLMFGAAVDMALFTNFGTALTLIFAAFGVLICFCMITVQLVVALVESYIVVSAGMIFLGFGGSKWTVEYVQRYVGLCMNVGIKLFVIYLLIGIAYSISGGWLAFVGALGSRASPMSDISNILGSSLVLAAICWQAPKLISTMIGGSPQFSGGDLVGATAGAGTAVGTAVGGMTMGVAALARMVGGGGGGTGVKSVSDATAMASSPSSGGGNGGVTGGSGGGGVGASAGGSFAGVGGVSSGVGSASGGATAPPSTGAGVASGSGSGGGAARSSTVGGVSPSPDPVRSGGQGGAQASSGPGASAGAPSGSGNSAATDGIAGVMMVGGGKSNAPPSASLGTAGGLGSVGAADSAAVKSGTSGSAVAQSDASGASVAPPVNGPRAAFGARVGSASSWSGAGSAGGGANHQDAGIIQDAAALAGSLVPERNPASVSPPMGGSLPLDPKRAMSSLAADGGGASGGVVPKLDVDHGI